MVTSLSPGLVPVKNKKKSKKARQAQPEGPKIYLCTPIPAFESSWGITDSVITNEIIPIQQEVAKEYGLEIIDLHTLFAEDKDKVQSDGIHPNDKGVRKMAQIISEVIKPKQ